MLFSADVPSESVGTVNLIYFISLQNQEPSVKYTKIKGFIHTNETEFCFCWWHVVSQVRVKITLLQNRSTMMITATQRRHQPLDTAKNPMTLIFEIIRNLFSSTMRFCSACCKLPARNSNGKPGNLTLFRGFNQTPSKKRLDAATPVTPTCELWTTFPETPAISFRKLQMNKTTIWSDVTPYEFSGTNISDWPAVYTYPEDRSGRFHSKKHSFMSTRLHNVTSQNTATLKQP